MYGKQIKESDMMKFVRVFILLVVTVLWGCGFFDQEAVVEDTVPMGKVVDTGGVYVPSNEQYKRNSGDNSTTRCWGDCTEADYQSPVATDRLDFAIFGSGSEARFNTRPDIVVPGMIMEGSLQTDGRAYFYASQMDTGDVAYSGDTFTYGAYFSLVPHGITCQQETCVQVLGVDYYQSQERLSDSQVILLGAKLATIHTDAEWSDGYSSGNPSETYTTNGEITAKCWHNERATSPTGCEVFVHRGLEK